MGLVHGKQLRNNTVGFTKLIANQNLDMSGVSTTFRIVNLADGFMSHHAVNLQQLENSISDSYTNIVGGDGLNGSGTTSGGTITLGVNVDNQGIFIINDIIKLGDVNNNIYGDFTFTNDLHVGGDVLIDGNVTILGTATTINTDDLWVKDNRIVLNSTATSGGIIPRYSGVDIFRGNGYTDSSGLLWDNTNKTWVIQSPWLNTASGSGTTNNNAILTTGGMLNGNAIEFTIKNTDDGIDNSLQANVRYDNSTIKLNGGNELYVDLGSVSADTFISSAQLTGGTTLVLHRNDSVNITADLSSLHSVDSYLTATTLTPSKIVFEGSETFTTFSLTGLSTTYNASDTISANRPSIELGGAITFDVIDNSINVNHIDFGTTGATQVDAAVIPIDSITPLTATTVQEALEELNTDIGLTAVPTTDDKNITPTAQSSDGVINTSGNPLTLTEVPAEGSQVMMLINGVTYIIGSTTSDDIYFYDGMNAVLPANVTTSTQIYFKTTTLFDLDVSDRIDLIYMVLR